MILRFSMLSSLLLAACTPATDTDGADTDTDVETDTLPCTDLVNGGAEVPETSGLVFFGAAGGEAPSGTYHLTEFKVFAPGTADANVRKHALRFTEDTIEVVTQRNDEPEVRMSGTFEAVGTQILVSIDCPETTSFTLAYTTSETTFTESIDDGESKEMHTYTLQ